MDSDDDDVPISMLREHIAWSKKRKLRELKRSFEADAEPVSRRPPKKSAVAYDIAKADAEQTASKIKQKHTIRDSAPSARQCAEFVLENIQAMPSHIWFAEPA